MKRCTCTIISCWWPKKLFSLKKKYCLYSNKIKVRGVTGLTSYDCCLHFDLTSFCILSQNSTIKTTCYPPTADKCAPKLIKVELDMWGNLLMTAIPLGYIDFCEGISLLEMPEWLGRHKRIISSFLTRILLSTAIKHNPKHQIWNTSLHTRTQKDCERTGPQGPD